MAKTKLATAVAKVERAGALVVFPVDNRAEPPSLWARLHPGVEMRWDWDDGGDARVFDLWHLRTRLSLSREVVYSKWFRGRATVLARDVFAAMLALVREGSDPRAGLSAEAGAIMEVLDETSPVSTKELRKLTGLQGKLLEPAWTGAMQELWSRLLIVGYGEVEDGAFPSLAVGAARSLFDDLWEAADAQSPAEARALLAVRPGADSLFYKHFMKQLAKRQGAAAQGMSRVQAASMLAEGRRQDRKGAGVAREERGRPPPTAARSHETAGPNDSSA
jgi:hypothetical protein